MHPYILTRHPTHLTPPPTPTPLPPHTLTSPHTLSGQADSTGNGSSYGLLGFVHKNNWSLRTYLNGKLSVTKRMLLRWNEIKYKRTAAHRAACCSVWCILISVTDLMIGFDLQRTSYSYTTENSDVNKKTIIVMKLLYLLWRWIRKAGVLTGINTVWKTLVITTCLWQSRHS